MKAVSPRVKSKSFDSTNKIFRCWVSSIFTRGAEIEQSIVSPSINSKTYSVQKGRTTIKTKLNMDLMELAPPLSYTKQLPYASAHILGFKIITLRACF
jgi:hypothetical protein